MQSLVLAGSLLLSSQTPITTSDIESSITDFVKFEQNRVSQVVHYKAQVAAQHSFLYRAKLVIQQAKQDRIDSLNSVSEAE